MDENGKSHTEKNVFGNCFKIGSRILRPPIDGKNYHYIDSAPMNKMDSLMVPEEVIIGKIYLIRGRKVMLDRDLSILYNVETKRLKEAVRRNITRFPEDFMFELSNEELKIWRSQFGNSSREKMGLRILPFAFTEYGVLMLASVLNSERAVQVNIQIVRIFTRMREMMVANSDIIEKLNKIERRLADHDEKILLIFSYIRQLETTKHKDLKEKEREPIGFKQKNQS
jgi:phage regulator Rha-like protein